MAVAQVVRHRAQGAFSHLFERGVYGRLRSVRLRGERHVDGCFGQIDAAFGIADGLGRLERGGGYRYRAGVGQADILAGRAQDAAAAATTPEVLQAAAVMFATLPIICIYPFLQKYFVKGVMIGAVKG